MNLGDFRMRTMGLPDDAELVLWDDEQASWFEVRDHQELPPTPIHPTYVLVFEGGQQVELDFDLAVRTGIDDGVMVFETGDDDDD